MSPFFQPIQRYKRNLSKERFLFSTATKGIKRADQKISSFFIRPSQPPHRVKKDFFTREGLDKAFTSFQALPALHFFQGERGMGLQAHFISLVALRVTAVGRNP